MKVELKAPMQPGRISLTDSRSAKPAAIDQSSVNIQTRLHGFIMLNFRVPMSEVSADTFGMFMSEVLQTKATVREDI